MKHQLIKLYKCPACAHANHEGCTKLPGITEAITSCGIFKFKGQAPPIFYEDCPNCEGTGMLCQDKFGAYCIVSSCDFTQNYEDIG